MNVKCAISSFISYPLLAQLPKATRNIRNPIKNPKAIMSSLTILALGFIYSSNISDVISISSCISHPLSYLTFFFF